ncbi:MAG: hypothetical protein FRX49_13361 [Trebouxia sp. A1-2]|nr:MAG: hypothetical protein FRX49_13361 [Trebouxia sp. A1-2]
MDEVFINQEADPHVIEADGTLDIAALQLQPATVVINGKKGLVDVQTSKTKRTFAQLREKVLRDATAGSMANPLRISGAWLAGSPSASDQVAAFKAKLALHSINRPNADAISRLLRHFPQQMLMMAQPGASPDDAMLLYKQVLAQPGTQTALNMVADLQIAVIGPWLPSHPQLVTGVDLRSKCLLVLKLLPPCSDQQKLAAQSERHAINTLGLDSLSQQSALVNCCLVKASRSYHKLSDDIIYEGALRLESALQEMHAANLLHADVKSDNVVLNTADKWHLADYGACVEFGQPIKSCTEDIGLQAWYPGAMQNQTAIAKYDWGLLVVLIAVEMGKQQPLTELTGESAPARVQLPLVLARCRAIVHRDLKQLVEQFIHKAGWL